MEIKPNSTRPFESYISKTESTNPLKNRVTIRGADNQSHLRPIPLPPKSSLASWTFTHKN